MHYILQNDRYQVSVKIAQLISMVAGYSYIMVVSAIHATGVLIPFFSFGGQQLPSKGTLKAWTGSVLKFVCMLQWRAKLQEISGRANVTPFTYAWCFGTVLPFPTNIVLHKLIMVLMQVHFGASSRDFRAAV